MDPGLVTPYLVAALIVWALYRRMRRSFGRQRVRDGRMWVRVGVLTAISILIGIAAARDIEVLAALLAGIACGAALGWVGLRHTKFEVTPQGRFYTPHAYIGLIVTALLVGRLLYRFLAMYNGAIPAATAGQGLAAAYQKSPLTLAVFGMLAGYYVLYYAGVVQRTRLPAPVAQKAAAPPTPGQ